MTDDRTASGDRIVIERLLEAPASLVWAMWTEPDHFASWYGPDGATIPEVEFDLRVGGVRRVCMEMTTPGGPMRMWFLGEHVELRPHHLLVYTEQVTGEDGAPRGDDTQVRVELTEEGARTRMVMTHLGVPEDSPGATGWAMAFDKLDARVSATR